MSHPVYLAVTRVLIVVASTIVGAEMSFADYPKVSDLPSRPELPDPLVMLDGRRVTSAEAWVNQRKPELKGLFQHYMYGQLPPRPDAVTATVDREDPNSLNGKATLREVSIGFGPPLTPKIHLLLVVPNKRSGPTPLFLGLNFNGNHTVMADPSLALPGVWMPPNSPGVKANRATDAGRGHDAGVWSVEKVIDRGYALATFYSGDIAPDHPGFADGVFPSYAHKAGDRGPSDWGAVAAWAWGLSRALDYLVTHPDIDKGRVAVVGHSRLGKAALLAGAFDDRFALIIAHQAGCGGSAPSRGKVGEQVKQINTRFPHWYNDEFKLFNDRVDQLPFDQNSLIALASPRPLLLTNGTLDTWANPVGQFEALKAADGVYQLMGVKGLGDQSMPSPGQLVGDRLGYHLRVGPHAMLPEDWDTFLRFADQHLKPSK